MRIAVVIAAIMAVNIGASLTESMYKTVTSVAQDKNNDYTTETNIYSNDEKFLDLAEEYAAGMIPEVERQQAYWYQHLNPDSTSESSLDIISARVETFKYAVTYDEYIIFRYNGSFLPSEPEKIFSIDEWELRDDAWYTDLRPQYMIFRENGVPELLGVMLCEFTPNGNSEMFYSDLDRWIEDYENDSRNLK